MQNAVPAYGNDIQCAILFFLRQVDDWLALFLGVSDCGQSAAEVPVYAGNHGIGLIYHPAASKLYGRLVMGRIQFFRNNDTETRYPSLTAFQFPRPVAPQCQTGTLPGVLQRYK